MGLGIWDVFLLFHISEETALASVRAVTVLHSYLFEVFTCSSVLDICLTCLFDSVFDPSVPAQKTL